MTDLPRKLEAFLFAEGAAVPRKKLAQFLECSPEQLAQAAHELAAALAERGIALIQTETEIALVISPVVQGTLDRAFEKELGREIGEAGLEVLSILLYRGASTRAQIDYVRGVNSSSTMRTLLARGLIERVANPTDAREYLYRPTVELLSYLGVTEAPELPEYATIRAQLAAFEDSQKESGPFGHDKKAPSDEENA